MKFSESKNLQKNNSCKIEDITYEKFEKDFEVYRVNDKNGDMSITHIRFNDKTPDETKLWWSNQYKNCNELILEKLEFEFYSKLNESFVKENLLQNECRTENLKYIHLLMKEMNRIMDDLKPERAKLKIELREKNLERVQEYAIKFCNIKEEIIEDLFDQLADPVSESDKEKDNDETKHENSCIKEWLYRKNVEKKRRRLCAYSLKKADEKLRSGLIGWYSRIVSENEEKNDEIKKECFKKASKKYLMTLYRVAVVADDGLFIEKENFEGQLKIFKEEMSKLTETLGRCYLEMFYDLRVVYPRFPQNEEDILQT